MILPAVCLVLTIAIYGFVKRFYKKYPKIYFTPLVVTPAILVLLLVWTNIPYNTYDAGAHWVTDMIGPATIVLAVPIYKNLPILKKHAFVIVSSVLFGSTIAIVTTAWIAKALNLDARLIESLAPRSATTPIAMAVSKITGGIPTITAVIVLLTGVLGIVLGPLVIRFFGIRNDVARGVLFGTGAHAAGTSKAFEFGSAAGSISSIAMILTAFFTFMTVSLVIGFFI
ncbi:LrgB [Cohnella kolymensis]|uniref:LrgB n=1 Tax=Cohnella kolymensis TaxID=1590652 RepID=A0ABR5A9D4_9BACL|nr:LrgB family protein [Cohnella kolymensis]KIL37596.1 LrgB [Cohnella kolymensis]